MPTKKGDNSDLIKQARKEQAEREKGYRERSLKMYPHVCGRCGRDFSGKNLKQLTVHHRDHNHDNNPPDGSNWELLCIYCHDNEHARNKVAEAYSSESTGIEKPTLSHNPFANLGDLLKKKK